MKEKEKRKEKQNMRTPVETSVCLGDDGKRFDLLCIQVGPCTFFLTPEEANTLVVQIGREMPLAWGMEHAAEKEK